MNCVSNLRLVPAVIGLSFLFALSSASISAVLSDDNIDSRMAAVDGVELHYLTAGHGPALILLHGYAETSRMWKAIIPRLAEKFTVIAPDLPGIGDSAIPANGLDMKTSAIRIHALARELGVEKARVVGHDIGLMVAYAYAAQFPAETEKLVVMDAFLPGVPGWEAIYNDPNIWHFRFHGPTPEALVKGRERTVLRILLERSRRRQDTFHSGSRSESVYRGLLATGANACRLGLLCLVSASREGFQATCADQAADASAVDRRG